jgi:4-alpha-glucanotransferase
MPRVDALRELARTLGVHTEYTDGLNRHVVVDDATLVRVCRALGAPVGDVADAPAALAAVRGRPSARTVPPVVVAWEGALDPVPLLGVDDAPAHVAVLLTEGGEALPLRTDDGHIVAETPLPFGYHRLVLVAPHDVGGGGSGDGGDARLADAARAAVDTAPGSPLGANVCTVISSPVQAWRRDERPRSWGVGTQLAALRSRRSRSVGDLHDLRTVCRRVRDAGGDLVTVLPLLPTFNGRWPEPSPYSPVSRLFWSELILDLGEAHAPTAPPASLDVTAADAEVRRALSGHEGGEVHPHDPGREGVDPELARYARFRGAEVKLGRNWRDWPEPARSGHPADDQVDPDEARFHRVAQTEVRRQLDDLRDDLGAMGVRLGLDLAVGVHPDGYDVWSRQELFALGMSVGAPPDGGFPSGQDWGFPPVLPAASRAEGHRYLAASIAHQAKLCGVLRVDHIMAWTRLYWIPHGMGLHEGTYVDYPAEELFAILVLESHRNRCEVVGENLGTVPAEIVEALPRHRIWGMRLAIFEAHAPEPQPPPGHDMALIGTHDTPTFAGWIDGVDIDERVRCGLLDPSAAPAERDGRRWAARNLARALDGSADDPDDLLARVLRWLGASESPLVVPWLEDLWLEREGVNLPGTRAQERPNWQRPMARLVDDVFDDPAVADRLRILQEARDGS